MEKSIHNPLAAVVAAAHNRTSRRSSGGRRGLNWGEPMKSRARFLSLLIWALWGLLPAAALAQPPTTETIHERFDTTVSETACSGAVVPVHVTGRAVFHITEFDDGRFHLTGTAVGRFTTTDAGVTYTGRFTDRFGENSNSKSFNGTFTFSATGKGSDGSKLRLRGVAHFTLNARGDVTSEFERFTTVCR
jgi:hypothetical protein